MRMYHSLGILGLVVLVGCFESEQKGANANSVNLSEVSECGSDCSTDLTAARISLEKADFQGAYEQYKCADSAEAAFGAGLTRFLTAFESEVAAKLLDDLGLPPLSVSDLLGPDSLLDRLSARWSGNGHLSITGAVELEVDLAKAIQEVDDEDPPYMYYDFEARDFASGHEVELELSFDDAYIQRLPADGVMVRQFDCQTGSRIGQSRELLDNLDLNFKQGDSRYQCRRPYQLAPEDCVADGGSMTVISPGTSIGAPVEYRLNQLLLECHESEDDVSYSTPIGPTTSYPRYPLVRVSGSITTTTVREKLDVSDLHPLLDLDGAYPFNQARSDRTLTDLLQGAAGITADLALASCYFNRAAEKGGSLGSIPGALYGGKSMDVTAGDARVLSGVMALAAGAGQVLAAYDVNVPLDMLLCQDHDEYDDETSICFSGEDCVPSRDPSPGQCPDKGLLAERFNQGFSKSVNKNRFTTARPLFEISLQRVEQGIRELDETSLLVSNGITLPGLGQLRDTIGAGLISLDNGMTSLPYVTPSLYFDLDHFFDSPPSREGIAIDPILYERECDEYECWSDTELSPDFLDAFFEGTLDVKWSNGDYEWTDSEVLEDGAEEILRNIMRTGDIVFK